MTPDFDLGAKFRRATLDHPPGIDAVHGRGGQHAGNGFLMRRGFTVVWSGWQGDVPPGNDRLAARFPVIPGITGMVREEFIAENTGLLGDTNIEELSEERFVGTLVYPVADPNR